MRKIDASGLQVDPAAPFAPGPAPMLQWLPIAELDVDPEYQRPVSALGKRNIRKIAEEFTWGSFMPVVVSPVAGGRYAIIDGQHRATAALLREVEQVPCMVVIADRAAQAAAFQRINGSTTKISRLALHAAAVTAGDPEALELEDVCARAEVKVLRYPIPIADQKPGQTMALGALAKALRDHGRDTLVTALNCITQTSNVPGEINATTIGALCSVLDGNRHWRDAGGKLLDAMDSFDFLAETERARAGARKTGGNVSERLAASLRNHLQVSLGMEAA